MSDPENAEGPERRNDRVGADDMDDARNTSDGSESETTERMLVGVFINLELSGPDDNVASRRHPELSIHVVQTHMDRVVYEQKVTYDTLLIESEEPLVAGAEALPPAESAARNCRALSDDHLAVDHRPVEQVDMHGIRVPVDALIYRHGNENTAVDGDLLLIPRGPHERQYEYGDEFANYSLFGAGEGSLQNSPFLSFLRFREQSVAVNGSFPDDDDDDDVVYGNPAQHNRLPLGELVYLRRLEPRHGSEAASPTLAVGGPLVVRPRSLEGENFHPTVYVGNPLMHERQRTHYSLRNSMIERFVQRPEHFNNFQSLPEHIPVINNVPQHIDHLQSGSTLGNLRTREAPLAACNDLNCGANPRAQDIVNPLADPALWNSLPPGADQIPGTSREVNPERHGSERLNAPHNANQQLGTSRPIPPEYLAVRRIVRNALLDPTLMVSLFSPDNESLVGSLLLIRNRQARYDRVARGNPRF